MSDPNTKVTVPAHLLREVDRLLALDMSDMSPTQLIDHADRLASLRTALEESVEAVH